MTTNRFLIITRCSSLFTEVALLGALTLICGALCKKPNSMYSWVLFSLKFVSKVRQPPINNTRVDLLIVYFYFRPSVAAAVAVWLSTQLSTVSSCSNLNSSGCCLAGRFIRMLVFVRSLVDSLSFPQSLWQQIQLCLSEVCLSPRLLI